MSDNNTAPKHPLATRFMIAMAAPLLRLLARLLIASWRLERIDGRHHLDEQIANGAGFLPCCWHQRLSACVVYLLEARRAGLRPGFLVSPSRDGELVARVVTGLGATLIRGSATRTGARALRDLHATLKNGVSPIIHPDGPHGPGFEAKTGTLMLARMTGAPLLPMACSADRYWQIDSWDRLLIPKPFARVHVVFGAPVEVARGDDIETKAKELAERLDALMNAADTATGATPRPPRKLGRRRD